MKVNLKRLVILSLMVVLCLVLATAQRRTQRSRRSSKTTTQQTQRGTRHTPKVGERETVTSPRSPDTYEPILSEPEQRDVVSPQAEPILGRGLLVLAVVIRETLILNQPLIQMMLALLGDSRASNKDRVASKIVMILSLPLTTVFLKMTTEFVRRNALLLEVPA